MNHVFLILEIHKIKLQMKEKSRQKDKDSYFLS